MDQFNLKQSIDLYYTGFYGKQTQPTSSDWQEKIIKISSLNPINTLPELFKVIEAIPSVEQVQSGFTYYWFASTRYPSWEKCMDCNQVEYKREEDDNMVKNKPDEWAKVKCEHEAKFLSLLLLWAGNSNEQYTKCLQGIVFKIRRSRIIIQLWYTGETQYVKPIFAQIMQVKQIELKEDNMQYLMEHSNNKSSARSSRCSSKENSRNREGSNKRDSNKRRNNYD